jgi:hypothetical protein
MATPSISAGEGRTRWRRFGLVGGIGLAAVALVGYLAMTGALALSFAISGIPFTLSADKLSGSGFVQFAYPDQLATNTSSALNKGAAAVVNAAAPINNTFTVPNGGPTFVSDTVTSFKSATISNLNQVICAPTLPGMPSIKVHLSGAGDTIASNLVIQAPALSAATADFSNITIGQTVKSAISSQGVPDPYGALNSDLGNSFAQGADAATLTGISQIGVGTEAGTFSISGLKLYAEFVGSCG